MSIRLLLLSCGLHACAAPWAASPAQAALERRVQGVVDEIASERGRPLRAPPVQLALPTEFGAISARQLPDDLDDWRLGLVALGIIDAGTDPIATMLEGAGGEIGGLYSPDEHRIFVSSTMAQDDVLALEVLRHELTHALQDQHFELKLPDSLPGDLQVAHKILVEGDATYTALAIQLGAEIADASTPLDVGLWRDAHLRGSPFERYMTTYGRRSYADGFAAVQLLRLGGGGWSAVDAAWAERPLSTEQLLEDPTDHPRYVGLDVRGALVGWVGLDADTVGQSAMATLLSAVLPVETVKRGDVDHVMRGWDGDRLQTLSHPDGRHAFVWRTVWDSTAEADRFAALVLPWRPRGQKLSVQVHGDEVLLLSGIPATARRTVRELARRGEFVEVDSLEALLALHGDG